MGLGVVDDIAVLAETDIKNKDQIVKRKSLYSQLQNKIQGQEDSIKEKDGTIETLTRQLVQAGIKNKTMQGSMEVGKKVHDTKSNIYKQELETQAKQKHLRKMMDEKLKTSREEEKMRNKPLQNLKV